MKRKKRPPYKPVRPPRINHKEVVQIASEQKSIPVFFTESWFAVSNQYTPYGDSIDDMHYETAGLNFSYSWFTPNSSKFGDGKFKQWKPFSHYKVRLELPVELPSIHLPFYHAGYQPLGFPVAGWINSLADANLASWFGEQGRWVKDLPPFIDGEDVDVDREVHIDSDLSAVKHMALRLMLYPARAELSSVNSLLELKDFLSIGQSVRRVTSALRHFSLLIRQPSWESTKKTLKELLHAASDSWLQLKFNFQPLVSDMLGVQQALMRHNDRIVRLMALRGRVQTRHWGRALNDYADSHESTVSSTVYLNSSDLVVPSYGVNEVCWRTVYRDVTYEKQMFHAQVRFIARYSELQVAHAKLLSLLDALDVVFDPAIVWNAIPWSFVIDWFVKVGDWFRDFRVSWMKPTIQIVDYLQSVKRTRRIAVRITTEDFPEYAPLVKVKYPTVIETVYDRQVGGLDASSIELSGLSLTEFSLAAALGVSVHGQRNKRRRVKSRIRKGIRAFKELQRSGKPVTDEFGTLLPK